MRSDVGGPPGEEITSRKPNMVIFFDGEVLDSSSEHFISSESLLCELSTSTIEL